MPSSLPAPFLGPRTRDPTHIPRPRNSFFLFRTSRVQEINEQRRITGQTRKQADLSKMLANEWKSLPQTKKEEWEEKARREKQLHAEKYPQYQYRPVRNKTKRTKQEKTKKPSNNDSRFNTNGTRGPSHTDDSHTDDNLPHSHPAFPNAVDSNDYDLFLHSLTWPCPPAYLSPFPLWNRAPEFMSSDQLAGIAFQDIYPPGCEYYTVTHT